MEFYEHPIFARQRQGILDDNGLASLMVLLTNRPDAGVLIPSGGGLRKLRVAAKGKGKSGGARVIYYWQRQEPEDALISFLSIYAKNRKENLSPKELKSIRKLIEDDKP